MAQVLHGCARTTQETRRAIQESKESLRTIAERYGVNIKTVARWRKRDTVEDAAMGPKTPLFPPLHPPPLTTAQTPRHAVPFSGSNFLRSACGQARTFTKPKPYQPDRSRHID